MTLYDEIFSQELKFCDGNKIAANARTLTFLAAVRKRVEVKLKEAEDMAKHYMDKDKKGNPFYIGQVLVLMDVLRELK